MNLLKNLLNLLKGKGLRVTITKPWPGDEKLKKIHPSYVERTDPLIDIAKSKEYKIRTFIKCFKCGKSTLESNTFNCEGCHHTFCRDCSTYENLPLCKECEILDKEGGHLDNGSNEYQE